MGYWEEIFPVRLVRPWHSLTREAADSSPLEIFKETLDGAILLQWKVSLPMAGDWNWIIFRIPTHATRIMVEATGKNWK